jgi:hypothetical protein
MGERLSHAAEGFSTDLPGGGTFTRRCESATRVHRYPGTAILSAFKGRVEVTPTLCSACRALCAR